MKYLLRGDDSQLYTVTRDDIYRLVCTPDMSEEDQELTILNWIESEDAQAFSDETFNDYQEATLETAKYPPNKALEYLSLGIASEAGEVAGKMKKWIRDGDSKMTREEWDMVRSVNVDSLFITTKAVLPHMKSANYGRIISASSINAFQGAFGQTNYSASKAAIVGFTHSLCREVGKYNITVNAVAPGFIKSEMTDSMPEEIIKAGITQIPVGRIGTPEDMAHAYLFLASKEAGFVSGHTLHANGGAMPI